jgi:hypothetical protein
MVSKRSPSSARSAPRVEPTARFRAALEAVIVGDTESLAHSMERMQRTPALRHCAQAFARAAAEPSRAGERVERIVAPSESLPPLP